MTDVFPPRKGDQEEHISIKVLRTVAAYANKEPTELPPLYQVVHPDGLDTIFASMTDGPERASGKVVFPYAGFQVTVWADGSVDIELPDTSEE